MSTWRLFIDESGDFGPLWGVDGEGGADTIEHVVVAGWLVDVDAEAHSERGLERALARVGGWLPRPLHAAHLGLASLHAIAVEGPARNAQRRAVARLPEAARAAAAQAVERWRRGQVGDGARDEGVRAALRSAQARHQAGALPRIEDLRVLEAALSALAPGERDLLVRLTQRALADLSGVVAEHVGARRERGEVMLIASSETRRGDATPTRAGDRYLTLLEALCVRVVDLLLARGGEHTVRLHVLGRDVFDRRVGLRTPLRRATLQALIGSLRGGEGAAEGGGARGLGGAGCSVRLEVEAVHGYEASTPAPLVLADFIANRARQATRGGRGALAEVSARAQRFTRLPLSDAQGRATMATTGQGGAHVEAARGGGGARRSGLTHPPLRRWACEQANEWAARVGGDDVFRWRG